MYIKKIENYRIDTESFAQHLTSETELLHTWFDKHYFKTEGLKAGAEIEFLILDKDYHLTPNNVTFINTLQEPSLIPEAGTSQLEINTTALPVTGNFLSTLHKNILTIWNKCCRVAQENQYHLALIGSMPQVEKDISQKTYITPHHTFYLMNESISKYRKGLPLAIEIQGEKERLSLHPESLAIEGLICSFQLHLEVNQNQSAQYYNFIQMLSAPLLALCSNAPFFYGKNLWSESRIRIFEQLYTFPAPVQKTVFFEPHYLKESFFPIFRNNSKDYPCLIPEVADTEPQNNMFHVKRQNSSIFRWNRPILDFNQYHEPYLRIEHRALSTGPTVLDMVANAAFFYGIVYYFVNQPQSINLIPFQQTMRNFYIAACHGLHATLQWNNSSINACTLLKSLLPLAAKGLQQLEINTFDSNYYLNIIEKRLARQQNGSLWQQKYIAKYGQNFERMLEQYLQNQYSETPVSDWSI